MMAYAVVVYGVWLRDLFDDDGNEHPVALAGVAIAVAILAVLTLETAKVLPESFEKYYGRARWLGIFVGALGFPILTPLAYVALSRLERYRRFGHPIDRDSSDETDGQM